MTYKYLKKIPIPLKYNVVILFLLQVYHLSRNTWFKMETRMIKNVCAPAVVLGERIVIVGGEFEQRIVRPDTNLASAMEKQSLTVRCCSYETVVLKAHSSNRWREDDSTKFFSHPEFSLCLSVNMDETILVFQSFDHKICSCVRGTEHYPRSRANCQTLLAIVDTINHSWFISPYWQ